MSEETKNQELPEYVILHERGFSNIMLCSKAFLDMFGIFTDKSQSSVVFSTQRPHNCCKESGTRCTCQRFDSILCGMELNHAKSRYAYGPQEGLKIVGIYLFDGVQETV